jgi:hypothetical protein
MSCGPGRDDFAYGSMGEPFPAARDKLIADVREIALRAVKFAYRRPWVLSRG